MEEELFKTKAVKLLEKKIRVIRKGRLTDYKEGLIDGLIIAIRTIEN